MWHEALVFIVEESIERMNYFFVSILRLVPPICQKKIIRA